MYMLVTLPPTDFRSLHDARATPLLESGIQLYGTVFEAFSLKMGLPPFHPDLRPVRPYLWLSCY